MMMLNDLHETVILPDGQRLRLGGEENAGGPALLHGTRHLKDFLLDTGLPVWIYNIGDIVLERRVIMPYRQNSVHITYRMVEGNAPIRIELRPAMNFRMHDAPVNTPLPGHFVINVMDDRYEIAARDTDLPHLRMHIYGQGSTFTYDRGIIRELVFRVEESRGHESRGDLWSPGYFSVELSAGHSATLVASTERWETILTLRPTEVTRSETERRALLLATAGNRIKDEIGTELLYASDQFVITPAWRREDAARAHAAGSEVRSIIAGYHWFTDWGRDTMIGLEGLVLIPGRYAEAASILHTFAGYIQDGLIPNMFPEAQKKGRYNTADATLWFFHAIDRYLEYTNDRTLLSALLPRLIDIVEHHIKGTRFGIKIDPDDDLLTQGAEGYQLTWMDAKVGDWVVTPRRGKAVEINALWYNALKLLEQWVLEAGNDEYAAAIAKRADNMKLSFNRRFWYRKGGYLYDVVDGENGDDSSCRPNQLLAMSLHYPVLDNKLWEQVLSTVQERLLTPVGVRSLAPGDHDYKEKYYGNIRVRDAAYHQGTVWAWLIGPFIDAWLKMYPADKKEARRFLEGFVPHLREAGIGSISEIFDAEAPFTPRGCIAQAWSVAEVLRCWIKTAE